MTLRKTALSVAIILAHFAGACSDSKPVGTGAAEGHAHAGVVPGSYEDWCAEHALPESRCTRCDSSLVAAFKATGDWCAEHGLPESQCVTCDPSRKATRPAPENAPK